MDFFLSNMQLFASQDFNWWTGVVWSTVRFSSAVWTHSEGTHSLQRIHWREKKHSHLSCFECCKMWCLCNFILTLNWSSCLWGWNGWTYKWQKRLANNCICNWKQEKVCWFTLLTTFCCWACFCLKVATSLQSVSFSLWERVRKMKYNVSGNEFC